VENDTLSVGDVGKLLGKNLTLSSTLRKSFINLIIEMFCMFFLYKTHVIT
jgi:hypothetical protein